MKHDLLPPQLSAGPHRLISGVATFADLSGFLERGEGFLYKYAARLNAFRQMLAMVFYVPLCCPGRHVAVCCRRWLVRLTGCLSTCAKVRIPCCPKRFSSSRSSGVITQCQTMWCIQRCSESWSMRKWEVCHFCVYSSRVLFRVWATPIWAFRRKRIRFAAKLQGL